MALAKNNGSSLHYRESRVEWTQVKSGSNSFRLVVESKLLPDAKMPLGIFLSFTDAESAGGTFARHSGWLTGL